MTEHRIRFRDLKPYYTVDSLDELEGPDHGTITLPITIYWSGTCSTFDMDNLRHRLRAYSALLSHAGVSQLREFVSARRLVEDWARLEIDQRTVDLWNSRHPQLASIEREW